jgi:hypothetical protein
VDCAGIRTGNEGFLFGMDHALDKPCAWMVDVPRSRYGQGRVEDYDSGERVVVYG